MSRLKAKNVEKCFSLLREFIDEAEGLNNKKGIAILALNQLQKIAAGNGSQGPGEIESLCIPRPRAG